MKIIISPAKKMQDATADFVATERPRYFAKTCLLYDHLQKLSYQELRNLWQCSEKLAQVNYQQLQHTKLDQNLTPALFSYVGLQYSAMAPDLLEESSLNYLQRNLRILSGLYGILAPFDGIVQYRLEMGAKVAPWGDLYHFWGSDLYAELYHSHEPVLNLASKEYSKAILPYLTPQDVFITLEFKEFDPKRQKYVQKATYAKQARGQFVRYLAQNQVQTLEQVQAFSELGYHFEPKRSTADKYVFLRDQARSVENAWG